MTRQPFESLVTSVLFIKTLNISFKQRKPILIILGTKALLDFEHYVLRNFVENIIKKDNFDNFMYSYNL